MYSPYTDLIADISLPINPIFRLEVRKSLLTTSQQQIITVFGLKLLSQIASPCSLTSNIIYISKIEIFEMSNTSSPNVIKDTVIVSTLNTTDCSTLAGPTSTSSPASGSGEVQLTLPSLTVPKIEMFEMSKTSSWKVMREMLISRMDIPAIGRLRMSNRRPLDCRLIWMLVIGGGL